MCIRDRHVGETGDAFTVFIAVFERFREMVGYQQGEIGVFRIAGRIFIAVSIDGHDAVGVLIDDDTSWVHTERAHHRCV